MVVTGDGEQPIYAQTQRIISSLEALAKDCADSSPALSQEAKETRLRFEKWCKRLGAHLRGVYSLDERLRDASAVKRHVLDCLEDIADALGVAQTKSHGPGPIPSPSTGDEDTSLGILMTKSTIANPLGFVNSMLDVLFRVIPIIRPALSADRYERAMSTVLPDEEEFKQLCSSKLAVLFPKLTSQLLLARLVLASLQRRRFLHYAANYSLKFQSDVDRKPPDVVPDRPVSAPIEGGEAPTAVPGHPSDALIHTSGDIDLGDASSFVSRADPSLDPFGQPPGVDSDTSSMRSMAMSHRETIYPIPPFPADSENELRECVACHLTLPLPTKQIWRAHILRDIRPYVCTFPDCVVDPNKLYSSRRAWFEHEVTFHRRRWPCPLGCPAVIPDLASFREHIALEHRNRVEELSSHPMPRGQEIPANAEAECPFCKALIKPRRQIESHIAWHHVQVGLMVLQSSIIQESDEEASTDESEADSTDLPEFPTTDLPVALDTQNTSNAEVPHEQPLPDDEWAFWDHSIKKKGKKKTDKLALSPRDASDTEVPHEQPLPDDPWEPLPRSRKKKGKKKTDHLAFSLWDESDLTAITEPQIESNNTEENMEGELLGPSTSSSVLEEELQTVSRKLSKKAERKKRVAFTPEEPDTTTKQLINPAETGSIVEDAHVEAEWPKDLQAEPFRVKPRLFEPLPSLRTPRADPSSKPGMRQTWFLMPNFDFSSSPDSPIRLGQALTDPHNPAGGLLGKDVLSFIMPPETSYQRMERNAVSYSLAGLDISAETMITHLFHPSVDDYLSALANQPEVAGILGGSNLTGSRTIFIITGLMVMSNSRVVNHSRTGMSVNIPVGGTSVEGGLGGIGFERSSDSQMAYSIPGEVIFAYSLARARRSFLGSVAVDRYTKGALF